MGGGGGGGGGGGYLVLDICVSHPTFFFLYGVFPGFMRMRKFVGVFDSCIWISSN